MRRMPFILVFSALAALSCLAGGDSAQSPNGVEDDAARAEILTLIRDFAQSHSPKQWFDNHKAEITEGNAAAADEMTQQALERGQIDVAYAAAMFAGFVHLHLGEPELSLESMLNATQAQFMLAEKPEEYAVARESALALQKNAQTVGRKDLTFELAVLAADSAFFQATAAGERPDEAVLLLALRDVAAALPLARESSGFWFERFVSLTGAVIAQATERYYQSQEQFEAVLKEMAPTLEQVIPPDFEFREQKFGSRRKVIQEAMVLAQYSYRYGNPAIASARLAIAEQRAREEQDVELALDVIHRRYRGERDTKASVEQLKRLRDDAWRRANELRANYFSRAGRIWASYLSDGFYGEMLNDQLVEGSSSLSEAFGAIESLKARFLLDRLTMTKAHEIETPEARDLERRVLGFSVPKPEDKEDPVLSELRLISQLSGFSMFGDESGTRSSALDSLEALYQKAGAGFQEVAPPAALESIQQALEPREALLEYVVPYHPLHPAKDLWLLLITRTDVRGAHLDLDKVLQTPSGFTGRISVAGGAPVDSSKLGDLVIEARIAIRRADETRARELLKALHEILIQPLMEQGARFEDFSRLIVVPHAMLHYVPFSALIDRKDAFLISKVPIVVVPSASVWRISQSRTSNVDRWVAFANPDLTGRGVAELPFADQEVAEIAEVLPKGNSTVFRRGAATKDKFLSEGPKASLLHLSTHGEFPDESALDLHAILLAGMSKDADLRAEDVRKTNLSCVRLVALSVCNGGLYRIGPADEPYGLMPAFLEAGAHNVIGTLWPVEDRFGRDFMIEFYRHLTTEGPAGAYRKACLRFIQEDEFIRRWAGFVVVGPGRPFTGGTR